MGGTYDFFLSYLLSRNGEGAFYVPERLASWRIHSRNLTSETSLVRAEEGVAAIRTLIADERLAELRPELRDSYGRALWCVGTRTLRDGSRKRAACASLAGLKQWLPEDGAPSPGRCAAAPHSCPLATELTAITSRFGFRAAMTVRGGASVATVEGAGRRVGERNVTDAMSESILPEYVFHKVRGYIPLSGQD